MVQPNDLSLPVSMDGGGCASKVSRDDLNLLLGSIFRSVDARASGQIGDREDAAIVPLDAEHVLVASVDLMTPVVSDPATFGKIAVANSLSDLYAKGVAPEWALNVMGFPEGVAVSVTRQVLAGAMETLHQAGVALVGGHTLNSADLFCGFCCVGRARAEEVIRNGGARPGDDLVLTKPLGTGVVTQGAVEPGFERPQAALWSAAIDVMLQLNAAACSAMRATGVSAATDVSGFGLVGHLREMLAASGVGAEIWPEAVPVLDGVEAYMGSGYPFCTIQRNFTQLVQETEIVPSGGLTERTRLLFDSQTSGGLLIALPPSRTPLLLSRLRESGVRQAAHIGRVLEGELCGLRPIRILLRRPEAA